MKSIFKIALIAPNMDSSGGVRTVSQFIKDTIIRSERYSPKLISLAMSSRDSNSVQLAKPRSWLQGIKSLTHEWEGLPLTQIGTLFSELEFQRYAQRKKLRNLVADCDLIQVVSGSPALANSVIGLGKPVSLQVATLAKIERRMRDYNPQNLTGLWRKFMTEITSKLDNRALRLVDAIQVENPWMFEYVREINSSREIDIRYAPPGIDSKFFCPLSERDLSSNPYILCVGRLDDPRKNIGLLLDAYTLLPEILRSKVQLVLAGSSAPPDSFWERVTCLNLQERVTYVPKPDRQELLRYYQGASVFALPSDEEGLGVVLLEAMACSVPIVSTKSGGPDGIIDDGADGFLVPLNDAKFMAGRLQELLENTVLNRKMGQKARVTIERRYDERVAGEVFIEMWDRLKQMAIIQQRSRFV